MNYYRKFQKLLEIELDDVVTPDYVVLTYAVCAVGRDACEWGGWMIEAAFKYDEKKQYPSSTGDMVLWAFDKQICPECGKETFRTGATIVMEPSKNKELIEKIFYQPYEIQPIEYED